jgi:hypothetical protein
VSNTYRASENLDARGTSRVRKSHEQTIDTFQRVLYTIFPTTLKKSNLLQKYLFFGMKKINGQISNLTVLDNSPL